MSRIGKKEIVIPEKTTVTNTDGLVVVKGPLGELKRKFGSEITVVIADGKINLKPEDESLQTKALWGSYSSHIQNMIMGVNKGFEEKLVVEGIGYKADVSGKEIVLKVGFSHPVKKIIPEGVKVSSDKGVVTISGIDKEMVTSFAAGIKAVKKPEPYKGKGIRYENEIIRRKEGKKAA